MRYYLKDNELWAYDDEYEVSEDFTEVLKPIYDGKVLHGHPKIDEVELDTNGEFYSHYLDNGKPDIAKLDEIISAKELAQWHRDREEVVNNIEVEYNGVIYQGNEISQDRMARAILSLDDTTEIEWIAKDNSVNSLTKTDLKSILLLSGAEQSRLWNLGRP